MVAQPLGGLEVETQKAELGDVRRARQSRDERGHWVTILAQKTQTVLSGQRHATRGA